MATPRYQRFWLQLTDLFKLAILLWLLVTLRHRHPLSRSQLPIIFLNGCKVWVSILSKQLSLATCYWYWKSSFFIVTTTTIIMALKIRF